MAALGCLAAAAGELMCPIASPCSLLLPPPKEEESAQGRWRRDEGAAKGALPPPQPWGTNTANSSWVRGWKPLLWHCSGLCAIGWGTPRGTSGERLLLLGPASLASVPLCCSKTAHVPPFGSRDMVGPHWGPDLLFPGAIWGWLSSGGWRLDESSSGGLIPGDHQGWQLPVEAAGSAQGTLVLPGARAHCSGDYTDPLQPHCCAKGFQSL